MRHHKFSYALLFILPLFMYALAGCSSPPPSPEASKVARTAVFNQQIQNIDNNPNMPLEAKAAAKAAIERGQNVDMSIRK